MILDPLSIQVLKSIVNFTKVFDIETLLLSPDHTVAIDANTTLVIFFDLKSNYSGPALGLSRLKVLDQRLAQPTTSVEIVENASAIPKSIKLTTGRSTLDFKLANDKITKKLPRAFAGKFTNELFISVTDAEELIRGARIIDAKVLIFKSTGGNIVVSGSTEAETFQLELDSKISESDVDYTYTYSVTHLHGLLKLLQSIPGSPPVIHGQITANGQMAVEVATDSIVATIFLMDIKDR